MICGCQERCDCFAAPPTGTASVECMEGIIAEQKACVLYCGAGDDTDAVVITRRDDPAQAVLELTNLAAAPVWLPADP